MNNATEELIAADIETLKNGGATGMRLFMEMSKKLHLMGLDDALKNWIALGMEYLPPTDRAEVVLFLMNSNLPPRYDERALAASADVPKRLH